MSSERQALTLDLAEPALSPVASPLQEFVHGVRDAFAYTLIQAPVKGVSQLADRTIGTNWERNCNWFAEPEAAAVGTHKWYGQVLGGTVGAALPFIAMHRLVGAGAATRMELQTGYGLGRQALQPLMKSALTGAVYAGVFTPVREEDGNFWAARARNATVAGIAFPLLTAGAIGLKSTGNPWLKNDIVASALPGLPAGIVSADLHALLKDGKFATMNERYQSSATYMVGGAFLGGANMAREYLRPTSGIRGVRSIEDMKALAEKTRLENWEQRSPLPQEPGARRGVANLAPDRKTVTQVVNEAVEGRVRQVESHQHRTLSGTELTPANREFVASGQGDLVASLEAMQKIDKPKVTIYGSTRLGPNTFEHWRAQYLAGRLAQEGFAVVSGGADRGIMLAVNEAAYKAGGQSVGITIQLPNEPKASPYHDLTLVHRRFSTRKDVLRQSDAFVVEAGGIGTLDEAVEALTHMQTERMPVKPLYMYRRDWDALMPMLRYMRNQGTISPSDFNLFKLVDSPDQIVADLVRQHNRQTVRSMPIVQTEGEAARVRP